jgi:hypothetical protein
MFRESDERFAQLAADPERRRSAIRDLSRRRTVIFWCAIVASLGFLPIPFLSGSHVMGAGSAFAAALMWAVLLKHDSDVMLLYVIDRLGQS